MMILRFFACVAFLMPLHAAVDGFVTNKTNNQPQAGAAVALVKLAEDGSGSVLSRVTTDASGRFSFRETLNGVHSLETAYQGVTYSQIIPPMLPPNNLQVSVYETTPSASTITLDQHIFFLEPGPAQMVVSESFVLRNETQRTFFDSSNGTLAFTLPAEAKGVVQASFIGPDQRPRLSEAKRGRQSNEFFVTDAFPPGESRVDLSYVVPYEGGVGIFRAHTQARPGRARVVAPTGVTVEGDGLVAMGTEPRTQAQIFSLSSNEVALTVRGTGTIADAAESGAEGESPRIRSVRPPIYGRVTWIVAAGGLALLFAFLLLYRRPAIIHDDERKSGAS